MMETKLDRNSKLLGGSKNEARKKIKHIDMHCEADKNMYLGTKTRVSIENLVWKIGTSFQRRQ